MPKTRAEKEEIVNDLAKKLSEIKSASFASIHGYTMEDADTIRSKGRESGVKFAVTKKTLLKRAVDKAGIENLNPDEFEGSVLFAMGYDDEVSAAKLLSDLVEEKEEMKILGGILEGVGIGSDEVMNLSKLPSKQELLAKLVGSINSPVSGFVNVLAGNMRGFVQVLNSIKEQKV
jgi:large subunit ribosomal protein L10